MSQDPNTENENIIKIDNVSISREDMKITLHCSSPRMVSYRELKKFTDDFAMKLNNAKLECDYKCGETLEEYINRNGNDYFLRLAEHVTQGDLLSGELLHECKIYHKNDFVKVEGSEGTLRILKDSGLDFKVRAFVKRAFDANITIEFGVSEANGVKDAFYNTTDIQMTEEQIRKMVEAGTPKGKPKQSSSGSGSYYQNSDYSYREKYISRKTETDKRKPLTPAEGEEPPKDDNGNVIFKGKGFDARYNDADELQKYCEENIEFAYYGKIFSFNLKQIKKKDENGGEKEINIVSFGVTNGRDSVSVQFFIDSADVKYTGKMMADGNYIKVSGKSVENTYGYDKYFYIKPKNIVMMPAPPERMDNAEVKRVELHLHTHMSQQDALTDPELLVKRAIKWNVPAVAITDHGCVQAFPEVQKALNGINSKRKKDGKDPAPLKIIFGEECYLTNTPPGVEENSFGKKHVSYHCILLVKNAVGLKNLYKLISKSNLDHFYRHPNIPKYELDQLREGIIVGSACSEGELYRAMTDGATDEELMEIAKYYDYLEIQPVGNNKYLEASGFGENDIKKMNMRIVEIGDRLGKKTVATCDTHFLDPDDAIYRAVMQGGLGYDGYINQPPLFYRTTEEMMGEFEYLGDRAKEIVIDNTREIADQIEKIVPIPTGYYPPSIEGSDDQLRNSCYEKAHRLYGDPLPEIIEERLRTELDMIIGQGYSVMYIAAQELVANSARNGYQVGSRGSVGSSLAAYMAGITEVNSLPPHYRCVKCKYSEFPNVSYDCGFDLEDKVCPNCGEKLLKEGFNIPFETFLGFKDKTKTPDIDLNFAPNDQPSAHAYTAEIFGATQVFRAGTIATIAEKTAMGYVRKYLERSNIQPESVSPVERTRLALGFTGVKRTTGQHPGGIMVIPKGMDIYDFSPIQHPAEKASSGTITTQFDYHYLHDNILKLDILGHDGPEIIKLLEEFTGISCKDVPIDDPKMLSLFSGSEALGLNKEKEKIKIEFGTIGIPEFGTSFTQKMLDETRPTSVTELIRIAGLSHGTDVWNGNAQKLIADHICTLNQAICCRDDIMVYLIDKGLPTGEAFSIMESVRKGKGLTKEWEELMKSKEVPDWYITSCKKIKYMFPKAHAVAYVMLSLRIAWFKVYQPLAYYAAFFTQKVGEFDAANMIHGASLAYSAMNHQVGETPDGEGEESEENEETTETVQDEGGEGGDEKAEKSKLAVYKSVLEMYQREFTFLPIDLYKSHASRFVPEENGIRPPFACIAGVGEAAAESIVAARNEGGEFMSVDDLKSRAKITKSVIESLKAEHCLDGLPDSNMISLFEIM